MPLEQITSHDHRFRHGGMFRFMHRSYYETLVRLHSGTPWGFIELSHNKNIQRFHFAHLRDSDHVVD